MSNEEEEDPINPNENEKEENENENENNENQENENEEKENTNEEVLETISIPYDKLTNLEKDNFEIIEGKLSTITHYQPIIFNPETYKMEEKLKIKNEKGEIEYKQIPLENYIRWKYNQNKKIISNTKLIECSDGTHQLVIGNKFFDVTFSNMDNVRFGLNVDDNINVINQIVSKRMLISKNESDSLKMKYEQIGKSKVKLNYFFFEEKKDEEKKGNRYRRRNNIIKDKLLDKKRNRKDKEKKEKKEKK